MALRARAIMYHDVVEGGRYGASGFAGEGADVYKVDRGDFLRHLRAIHDAAAGTVGTLRQRSEWREGYPVLLTFDDGGESAHSSIAGMLEEHGWRGHFFVTTGRIGTAGFMSAEQIRDLHRRGHVIGSHSHTHPIRMAVLSGKEIAEEWRRSVAALAEILDAPVRVASVPGGYYSRQVAEEAARAGVDVLFNSEPTAQVKVVDGCLVLGRYVVQRGMGAEWAGGFAKGKGSFCWRQALLWKAKKAAKAMGGERYVRVRERLLKR